MPRLLKRPEAENDLEEIWWFIAQDSSDNADRFLDRIQETCLALSDFPKLGVSREELKTDLDTKSYPKGYTKSTLNQGKKSHVSQNTNQLAS